MTVELLPLAALIALGLALIAAEVYLVPGYNVAGIAGVLVTLFAVGYAFAEEGFGGGLAALVGTLVAGAGMFYALWQSGAWDRFVLAVGLQADAAREPEDRARYLGKTGVTITPLRPTGVVEVEGRHIEVQTEGEFIASGCTVRVVAMDRRRYFVRLAAASSPAVSRS